jgi:hypothetical protein
MFTSWGTAGWGEKGWVLSNAVTGVDEFVQIPFVLNWSIFRGLETGEEVSKAMTDKSRWSITSSLKSSIIDLAIKLYWLPPSNTQLNPVRPVTHSVPFAGKWSLERRRPPYLPKRRLCLSESGSFRVHTKRPVMFLLAPWAEYLAPLTKTWVFWPGLRQRKHRLAAFSFSMRSFTLVSFTVLGPVSVKFANHTEWLYWPLDPFALPSQP